MHRNSLPVTMPKYKVQELANTWRGRQADKVGDCKSLLFDLARMWSVKLRWFESIPSPPAIRFRRYGKSPLEMIYSGWFSDYAGRKITRYEMRGENTITLLSFCQHSFLPCYHLTNTLLRNSGTALTKANRAGERQVNCLIAQWHEHQTTS